MAAPAARDRLNLGCGRTYVIGMIHLGQLLVGKPSRLTLGPRLAVEQSEEPALESGQIDRSASVIPMGRHG